MTLPSRFELLLNPLTTDSSFISELWEELQNKYAQKFRAYHNTTHLDEIFGYFDTYQSQLEHPWEVAFAIFYHDAIYNIWKKDNEEKSAMMAVKYLQKLKISEASIERIEAHILATKTHQATYPDTEWMVDFDLAILGQPAEVYDNYTKNIRKEYRKIPLALYKPGRKKVLQHFLGKESIYSTQEFQNKFEVTARENLSRELESKQLN